MFISICLKRLAPNSTSVLAPNSSGSVSAPNFTSVSAPNFTSVSAPNFTSVSAPNFTSVSVSNLTTFFYVNCRVNTVEYWQLLESVDSLTLKSCRLPCRHL